MKKVRDGNPMKRWTKNLLLLHMLIGALGLILAGRATAQTFTTLHSFTATSGGVSWLHGTNADGASPVGRLTLSNKTLFGTTEYGGSGGNGTVFAVNTDGTGFTNLFNFTASSTNSSGAYTNEDGANSIAALVLSNNTLYGTSSGGGSFGNGTVFKLNTDGTGFTVLHTFTSTTNTVSYVHTNGDGAGPLYGSLILAGNILYGAAIGGGSWGEGTVFKLNTDGTSFTTLYNFTGGNDGAAPYSLVFWSNSLYGVAGDGGSGTVGTVFKLNTDGTDFTNLHTFVAGDGSFPNGLLLSGSTLYGSTITGGTAVGTVYALNTDGTGFRTLYNFGWNLYGYNPEGATPNAPILSGNTLYGTARDNNGPGDGDGTVFKLNTDGTGFTVLHSFTGGIDGAKPSGPLILSSNTLYGTTSEGGSSGNGTVFSISFTPQLSISPSVGKVILTWPTNFAGFDYTGYTLQSTTNFDSHVWTTNLPQPVVDNGQYTVTNSISGTQQFFRLSQ